MTLGRSWTLILSTVTLVQHEGIAPGLGAVLKVHMVRRGPWTTWDSPSAAVQGQLENKTKFNNVLRMFAVYHNYFYYDS